MAFGLPPAWQSGFALPDNVKDEGLERRGFVTKQMPRGTYDNSPADPTGGFAVPTYIRTEGYGQGARTTKWMRRGEYGPNVPQWIQKQPTVATMVRRGDAKLVTIQRQSFSGMGSLGGISGDPPLPEPFEAYGTRAAQAILSRINQLAPSVRKQQLKQILDRLDPSLWNRTAEITRRYVGQGLHATEAFPRGLARALSAGIAAEMIRSGQTSSAPQPASLLGLGCYGCEAALGATPAGTGVLAKLGISLANASSIASSAVLAATAPTLPKSGQMVQVGPFTFPVGDQAFQMIGTKAQWQAVPGSWKRYVRNIVVITDRDLKTMQDDFMAHPSMQSSGQLSALMNSLKPAPTNAVWNDWLQIKPGERVTMRAISPAMTQGKWSDADDGRAMPIAKFVHPVSQNLWGVFLSLTPNKDNPTAAQLYVKWIPEKPWYQKALDFIPSIIAGVIDVVKDVVEELGDLACQLATNPNAIQAGQAAGVASGGGAAAGAAGAMIAQQLCGGPKAPPLPPLPPPPPSDNLLPIVLIGGGVLVAALLLKKKKKAP
jgi:hypothetical protein